MSSADGKRGNGPGLRRVPRNDPWPSCDWRGEYRRRFRGGGFVRLTPQGPGPVKRRDRGVGLLDKLRVV